MKFTPDEIAKEMSVLEKAETMPPYEMDEECIGVWLKPCAFRVVGRMSLSAFPGDCEYIFHAANNYPAALAEIGRLRMALLDIDYAHDQMVENEASRMMASIARAALKGGE